MERRQRFVPGVAIELTTNDIYSKKSKKGKKTLGPRMQTIVNLMKKGNSNEEAKKLAGIEYPDISDLDIMRAREIVDNSKER